MSKFQKFYLYCAIHNSVFDLLQAVAKHRREKSENARNVKIICAECGGLFRIIDWQDTAMLLNLPVGSRPLKITTNILSIINNIFSS